jgi:DNA helicase II / ATP-dependent DNA helicase PcrA
MNYLEGLNQPQQEAVQHSSGPLMIIAGAGSGKTRVLTYRTAHLIEKGVDPFRILLLTFTNKAAGEMRRRVESIIGNDAKNLWMGTFHSVFAKILRFDGKHLGYTSDFSIYDTDDSKSLIRSIVKERGLDDKVYKANVVFNRISGAKNRLVGPDEYANNPIISADDAAAKLPEMGKLYKIYALRCFQANAMDFDDLLYNTNILFRDHPAVLDKYQRKFKYVMVDEFQDTNVSQYLIVKKLSDISQNLCVVGDDAQSIYAFRGASIDNILNLSKDYPEMTTIKLEQNYRSTQNIVEAANSIIAKNKNQLQKKVFTENEEGSLIELVKASSDNEEGRLVSTHIFESKMNLGLRNTDFAILYRTNSQSRTFEESLRKLNIKYRIIGGTSFYQRREIKDLLAYFRYTINQNDEEAFKRIINLPKRGIGDTTIAKISITANEQQISVWDVVSNIKQYQTGRLSETIDGFADLIKSFKIMAESGKKDAYEVASHIAKASGLLKELHEDKTVEGLSRYENVQGLLNSIKEFVDNPDEGVEDKNLNTFLQTVSLMTTADQDDPDGDNDRVTMMTIHGAKGLEFNHVYVVGMEEDLFPSQMMLQSRADLEEERRLFYVAVTRAEKKLVMSYAETRYQWGRLKPCEPSRFLDEIDTKYLQFAKNIRRAVEETHRLPQGFVRMSAKEQKMPDFGTSDKATPTNILIQRQNIPRPQVVGNTYKPSDDFFPSDTKNLTEGDRVEHLKFGFGKVKKIDTNGTDRKATIQFEGSIGEKTLLLSFAKLRIL